MHSYLPKVPIYRSAMYLPRGAREAKSGQELLASQQTALTSCDFGLHSLFQHSTSSRAVKALRLSRPEHYFN